MNVLNLALTALHWIGLSVQNRSKFSNFRLVISLLTVLIVTILGFLDVLATTIDTMGNVEFVPTYIRHIMISIQFAWDNKKWTSLLNKLNEFWREDKFAYFTKHRDYMSTARKCAKLYRLSIMIAATIFLGKPLMDKALTFSAYPICNLEQTPCYITLYLTQSVSMVFVILLTYGFETLYLHLVVAISIEFEALKYALKNLPLENMRLAKVKLGEIIEHHAFLLSFVADMEKVYSNIFLMQQVIDSASICFGFFMLNKDGIPSLALLMRYTAFLNALILQLIIYCIGGALIIEKSEAIADAVYEIKWWKHPELKTHVVFIIQRAQRTAALTVGGIINMNLEIFPMVMKLSLSYYTLMQSFNE